MSVLEKERRDKLIKQIDDWLQTEDQAWPQAAPDQRREIIDHLLTYGEQAKIDCERDYAVFCRAAIMMRADWRAFIEAEPQKALLLNESYASRQKVRAFFERAEHVARVRAQGGQPR